MLTLKTSRAYHSVQEATTLAGVLVVVSKRTLNGDTVQTSTQPMGIFSPWGFAILFLGPLIGEGLTLFGFQIVGVDTRLIGVALALFWATLAVWRGTWVGIKP